MTLTAHGDTGREDTQQNRKTVEGSAESFAPQIHDEKIRTLVKRFKLLSDETRLRILFYLANTDELHVRALCDLLSQSQPAVSHHLAMLRAAGVVDPRREGKHNFYRLLPGSFEQLLRTIFADVNPPEVASADGRQEAEDWQRPRPK